MPKEYALGLPKKEDKGDLSKLKPGELVDYIVQRHDAERAGTHYDIRFGSKRTGLYSWANRKGVPKPGEKVLAVRQPLHTHEYKDFEGEIPEGYGKGKVKKHEEGSVLVTKASENSIHFTKAHKKFPERFVLIKPKMGKESDWLLMNVTPTKPIPYEKIHYKKVDPDKAEEIIQNMKPGTSVQAKIDGAADLVKLTKGRFEVMSYRSSKTHGGPILHTERVTGNAGEADIPKKYEGTLLRGEIYGLQKGKVIPPQELGGLLNSSVEKSLKDQKDRGVNLKNLIFDIEQFGKEKVRHLPYEKRVELVKEVVQHLPSSHFHTPEEAKTPAAALALLRRIEMGKHPLTEEGVVIHEPHGKPTKVKFTDDHDVFVRSFFPGEKKWEGRGVGGFYYSKTPQGPIVGKVGTGFSDALRKDMHSNPSDYIGRVARVRAQEVLPSGALRAPALIALHEDYPMKKKAEISAKVALAYAALRNL